MDTDTAEMVVRRLDALARDVAEIRANILTKNDLRRECAAICVPSVDGPLTRALRKQLWTFVIATGLWDVFLIVAVYVFAHSGR